MKFLHSNIWQKLALSILPLLPNSFILQTEDTSYVPGTVPGSRKEQVSFWKFQEGTRKLLLWSFELDKASYNAEKLSVLMWRNRRAAQSRGSWPSLRQGYQLAGAAIKIAQTVWLKEKHTFSQLWSLKIQGQGVCRLVASGVSLLGLHMAVFLLCPLRTFL